MEEKPIVRFLRAKSFYVQIILSATSIMLFIWLPPAGVAVALIGFVAAVMSIHGDMRPWQKVVWMSIIGVLLVVEIRAIRHDRRLDAENLAQILSKQQAGFDNTANEIGAVIKNGNDQFTQTAQALQESLQATNSLLNQTRPRAFIAVDHVYSSAFPVRDISITDLKTNESYAYGIFYRNVGNDTARRLIKFSDLFVGEQDNADAANTISQRFEAEWKVFLRQTAKNATGELPVGTSDEWNTFRSHAFSAEEVRQVQQSPTMTLYIAGRFSYKDSKGQWLDDFCASIQKPLGPVVVYHVCDLGHGGSPYRAKLP